MSSFHEVRFPVEISMLSRGGPERATDVVVTASGREQRNARWAHARRRYDAAGGVTSPVAVSLVIAFFEERRGRLYGFRWRDRLDHLSCWPGKSPTPLDQIVGAGDGATQVFQLTKLYGGAFAPYRRDIRKPVADSIRVAVDGVERTGAAIEIDATTGLVRLAAPPRPGAAVTAGFAFDTPVRFDADFLEIDDAGAEASRISKIPLLEIRT